jgi:hypothetical protein
LYLQRFNRHKHITITQKRWKNKNSPYLTYRTRAEGEVIHEEQNRLVTSGEYRLFVVSPVCCRQEWVTKEKGSRAKTLAEVQNCFTTKDTKSAEELRDREIE